MSISPTTQHSNYEPLEAHGALALCLDFPTHLQLMLQLTFSRAEGREFAQMAFLEVGYPKLQQRRLFCRVKILSE